MASLAFLLLHRSETESVSPTALMQSPCGDRLPTWTFPQRRVGVALGRVLGPLEAKGTVVAQRLLLLLIKAPEVMAAAICAGRQGLPGPGRSWLGKRQR